MNPSHFYPATVAASDPYKHEAVSQSHVLEAGRGQMREDRLDKLSKRAGMRSDRHLAHARASILTYSSSCLTIFTRSVVV